ncbi:MAG: dicarboxylate/amino acid:cation symporter, partial [Clostridia bacterium]|nr:dicarboxylate/amino acid:cation symporter [Clostridia bacterium]
MTKKSVLKNYAFMIILLVCMILGALTGWLFPKFGTAIKPFGTVFINMMFCIVVPLVFASISSAVANMGSRKRAGKIMGVTIGTFIVTGAIAAVIMFVLVKLFPPVLMAWTEIPTEEMGDYASLSQMIVNFFTAEDFVGLLSRRAMLPLIVFSILFGFAVNLNGGKETVVGKFLEDLSNVMLKLVKIVTYYAPIAFFAIFADLVATYGAETIAGYGRALLLYYPLCFVYIFTAFPLFAWFGGGKGAVKTMFQHITRPAVVSLGTCSSVATIPTNLEEAAQTGISKDVAEMVIPLGATM